LPGRDGTTKDVQDVSKAGAVSPKQVNRYCGLEAIVLKTGHCSRG
jgi:hypothetical protein